MPGRYRYNPCNNCCRTSCDPGTTFISVTVRDGCNGGLPMAGATVTVSDNSTGTTIASGVTGASGLITFTVTQWLTYRITVSKTGYLTDSGSTVSIGLANCNATVSRSVTLSRNRIEAIQVRAQVTCGYGYRSGMTATISQAGSPTFTVSGQSILGGGTDTGDAYFYFFSCYYLPNVPITVIYTISGPYTPNTQTHTFTLPTQSVCRTNASIIGSSSDDVATWDSRGCPNLPAIPTNPILNAGYVCSPWGALPDDPSSTLPDCDQPYQVGDLSFNDPQVGGGTLSYKGCFGVGNPDGANYKGRTGLVWEGTTTYSSPGCTLSSATCFTTCACGGAGCSPGTFPATSATVTYLLAANSFNNQWELQITSTYRFRSCGSGDVCSVAQFADDDFLDMTLNPPLGRIFSANNASSNGGFLSTATCPPGIVLEFNCGPFVPNSASGSGANGRNPCEYPKGSRTVTVTA
jgi:hypothetical protein